MRLSVPVTAATIALSMLGPATARGDVIPLTVNVSPPTATNMVSATHTVTVTVKDPAAVPVAGATVIFSVTGVNAGATCTQPGGNIQTTDASGTAQCSYQGTAAGADTINASATLLSGADIAAGSGSAGKNWVNPAIALTPASDTNPIGTDHTVTATVSVPAGAGGSLSSAQVTFSVTGPNPQAPTVATTSTGGGGTRVATYTYTGNNTGMDTIHASVSNVNGVATIGDSTTATKNWVNPTAATVVSFEGSAARTAVRLVWKTAAQFDVLGFYVWRVGEGGSKVTSSLIAVKRRDGARGATYSFVDRRVRAGRSYEYRLQIVRLDGTRAWAGSLRVRLG